MSKVKRKMLFFLSLILSILVDANSGSNSSLRYEVENGPTNNDYYSSKHVMLCVLIMGHLVTFWGGCFMFAIADFTPSIACYRKQKRTTMMFEQYVHTVSYVIKSQMAIVPLVYICFLSLWRPQPMQGVVTTLVWIAVNSVITDFLFYHLHRLFHCIPFLLHRIHKRHHEWTAPVACAGLYAHPVEQFVVNYAPILCGPLVFQQDFVTVFIWVCAATMSVVLSHSGYLYLLGFPEHDLHHQYFDVHFGVFTWWDKWYQTCFIHRHTSHPVRLSPPLGQNGHDKKGSISSKME
jgi:sterol desaturase/sphingolipid hydroxylase (fatty acid hydroxylase superfamily)